MLNSSSWRCWRIGSALLRAKQTYPFPPHAYAHAQTPTTPTSAHTHACMQSTLVEYPARRKVLVCPADTRSRNSAPVQHPRTCQKTPHKAAQLQQHSPFRPLVPLHWDPLLTQQRPFARGVLLPLSSSITSHHITAPPNHTMPHPHTRPHMAWHHHMTWLSIDVISCRAAVTCD